MSRAIHLILEFLKVEWHIYWCVLLIDWWTSHISGATAAKYHRWVQPMRQITNVILYPKVPFSTKQKSQRNVGLKSEVKELCITVFWKRITRHQPVGIFVFFSRAFLIMWFLVNHLTWLVNLLDVQWAGCLSRVRCFFLLWYCMLCKQKYGWMLTACWIW
jgi:hypothetical protein